MRKSLAIAIAAALSASALVGCSNAPIDDRSIYYSHGRDISTVDGRFGPEHWGRLSENTKNCSIAKYQSPINIGTNSVSETEVVENLKFEYRPVDIELENQYGYLEMDGDGAGTIVHEGVRYELNWVHFRTPTEHAINGVHKDLEVQLIHRPVQDWPLAGNDDNDNLLIISSMYSIGSENPELAKILKGVDASGNIIDENLEKKSGKNGIAWDIEINPRDLLPRNPEFYYYQGSTTLPPCHSDAKWFIMKEGMELSQDQFTQLMLLHTTNTRPLQDARNHQVKKSNRWNVYKDYSYED